VSNFTLGRGVAALVAVLALAALPYAIREVYYVNIASQILLYAIFALGLNILVGYAGLVSLGHAGLFGVASYAVAYLLAAGHGHAVAILAGLAIALIATAVFAALSLRATGISFIMITLALGEIIWGLAYRWISVTNGDNGINVATRPEPFGLSMIEAMACGTPVVAYNRGSVPEVVEDGLTGFVVEDELSAINAVRRLHQLPRQAIRARFEERFTARLMAKEYLATYRSLMTGAVARPRLVAVQGGQVENVAPL